MCVSLSVLFLEFVMVKNYIFDFGNVLARFYPDECCDGIFKSPEEKAQVLSVVFDRLYWDRLDRGTIEEEEVISGIRSRLPEDLAKIGCRLYAHWIKDRQPIIGMPELVQDIHAAGGKLYLCSNISIRFAECYRESAWIGPLFALFDGLVFSGPLHITKPGREIFTHLLTKYELDPAECLFIDDSEKNIAGAAAVGIPGYLFDGDVDKLRKTLEL